MMITKNFIPAAVCLLLFKNVVSDNLSGCEWIHHVHLKCEGLNAVNESEILQYSYQNCEQLTYKKLEIVNSNAYTLDVTTLPPSFCNFQQISVISSNVGVVLANAFTMNQDVFEIDFSLNNIKNLDFMNGPFNKLSRLIISHNKLYSVNFDVLAEMRSLRELKLDHNNIPHIDEFSKQFKSLKTLDLSYNKIEYLDFDLGQFGALEILKIHGNPVDYFEYPMTKSLALKHFSVTNITELSEYKLRDLAESEILHIVDGRIERIESSTFLTHRNLKRLYLDNTTVSELSCQAFRESTLKYVGPSNNFYEEYGGAFVFDFTGMSVQKISRNVFQMITAPNPYLDLLLDKNQVPKIVSKTFFNLNLYSLSIGTSGIVELEPRSFSELRFLDCGHLDLSKNHIKKLKADVFHNLTKISTLNLANNSIEDIEVDAFNNIEMRCEARLILSNNKITSLSPQLFKNVKRLRKLYLNHNLLQTMDGIWLEGLVSLELLDLSNNLIAEVCKETFVHTPYLQTLEISFNRIENLTANVSLNSFKRLELVNNPLKASYIGKWNMLDMISWQFSELSKNTLIDFTNVKNLIVIDSCIETVQPMAFSETNSLINLYFINTTIKSLNDRAFESSKISYAGPYDKESRRSSVLDFSNLSIKDIGIGVFNKLNINQVEIILDNNNLTKIRSRTFYDINSLISIDIKNSGLIELEANSFINLSFEMKNLNTQINLTNNKIRILKTNTFRDITGVRCIDLSANEIEEVESTALFNIYAEEFKLLLNNNKIKVLSSFINVVQPNFSYLDLSDNLLTKLDGNEFRNIPYMGRLNLQNNRLENFNSSALEFFKSLTSVSLDGNPVFQSSNIDKNLGTVYVDCHLQQDGYSCSEGFLGYFLNKKDFIKKN